MDSRLSVKNIQDLKILHDIRRLLISMELVRGEGMVLASDDLYPQNRNSDNLWRRDVVRANLTKAFKSQSMYSKTVAQRAYSKYKSDQRSSGSSSNTSSSASNSNPERLYARNWQQEAAKKERSIFSDYHHSTPHNLSQQLKVPSRSNSQPSATYNRLTMAQTPANTCQLKDNVLVSSSNIEQSRFYKKSSKIAATHENKSSRDCIVIGRSVNQSSVPSSQSSCSASRLSRARFSEDLQKGPRGSSGSLSSSTSESHERPQDIVSKPLEKLKCGVLNSNCNSNLLFYPSKKAKCLQRTIVSSEENSCGKEEKRSSTTETGKELDDDLLDSVLNGRSLFDCSSKSPLYFQKVNKKTFNKTRHLKR
ncbi:uncharacterized protein [Watersipora subatra]|uniref:uncharacterized protein n=1 Tax=Watersipora subatra TaxID=2589382 RepID=UPI00355BB0B1